MSLRKRDGKTNTQALIDPRDSKYQDFGKFGRKVVSEETIAGADTDFKGKFVRIDLRDDFDSTFYEEVKPIKCVLYLDEDFRKAPSGIYNWIIFQDEKSKKHLLACKVQTTHELGATHAEMVFFSYKSSEYNEDLDRYIQLRPLMKGLYAAGELIKRKDMWDINFRSGTYGRDLVSFYAKKYNTNDFDILTNKIVKLTKPVFLKYGAKAIRVRPLSDLETFVSSKRMPLTKSNLEQYQKAQFNVQYFDTLEEAEGACSIM